jgi:hypothetical protein
MDRPERPDSIRAFLALSKEEKLLWDTIERAEQELLKIQEKKKVLK